MRPTGGEGDGDRSPVDIRPLGFRCRARWGESVVVDTSDAVRVDRAGDAPLLYVPVGDVRLDALEPGGELTDEWDGAGETWDAPPDAGPGHADETSREGWSTDGAAPATGRAVLRRLLDPPPDLAGLAGLVRLDHDQLRVEVLDERDPLARPDRWPTWGDARDLVEVLDVVPDGERRWVGPARADWRRPVLEASQILGQAVVAAMRESDGRRVVSAHMAFPRPADASHELVLVLEPVSAGRTFTVCTVRAEQSGRCCGVGTVLLDETAPDVVRHETPAPAVDPPAASAPLDMSVTARDLRVVDAAYTSDPDAPVGPPIIDAWVRFRDAPDDPAVHAGLLAQFTGHMSIAAGLRPHAGVGQAQAHRTLSTAINAIGLSFHREVRADRWMLYHHLSTFAGDGMTHTEGRVHDEEGALVASFTVDAMVRRFATPAGASIDDRRAL